MVAEHYFRLCGVARSPVLYRAVNGEALGSKWASQATCADFLNRVRADQTAPVEIADQSSCMQKNTERRELVNRTQAGSARAEFLPALVKGNRGLDKLFQRVGETLSNACLAMPLSFGDLALKVSMRPSV